MTKCSIRATSKQPDEMCKCCDIAPPLDDRIESGGASQSLVHVLDLKLMVDAGCRFSPNELTWAEWEGLKYIIIETNLYQNMVAEERQKAAEKQIYKPEFQKGA